MGDMCTLKLPNTDLNSTTINTTNKCHLLPIPGEVRMIVWRMLLTTKHAFKEPTCECDPKAHYELQPAIRQANRQIYNETRGILSEGNMWIFLCVRMPNNPVCYVDETARLPVVSRGMCSERSEIKKCYHGMEAHALNISLKPEYRFSTADSNYHTMIMGPESLPYLIQLLFVMLYRDRSILTFLSNIAQLYVGSPARFTRSTLQKKVLEPFLVARGFDRVFLNGNIDDTFSSTFCVEMCKKWRSDMELLEVSDAYVKKGDAAAAAGLTKAASSYYEQGSDFTFFAGQSYIDRFHPQTEHVYKHPRMAAMLNAFDVRWTKMLLKIRCYADVRYLATSILCRPRQFRAKWTDKVQLILCYALASLGCSSTAKFRQIIRGLLQFTSNLGIWVIKFGTVETLKTSDIFPNKSTMLKRKRATIKALDDLVAYCKEGEENDLQCSDIEGVIPDRKEIEFPVAQEWSYTSAKYERRRRIWDRNRSVPGLIWRR